MKLRFVLAEYCYETSEALSVLSIDVYEMEPREEYQRRCRIVTS